MLGSLTSLTGGGGLSASASSSTGAIGGDTFTQDFGGINVNKTPVSVWVIFAVVAIVLAVLAFKVWG
jgi:hypothetical protein